MKSELLYKGTLEKIVQTLKKYNSVLIYIQGSPDPDAIASSFAIKRLCDFLGIHAEIVSSQVPSLEQNKELIKKLKVPVKVLKHGEIIHGFDAYAIVDFQSAMVPELKMPCALHIDHHEPKNEDVYVDFRFIDVTAGSTSTIIALMFKEQTGDEYDQLLQTIGTILMIGIHVDTDKTIHATRLDFIALAFLEKYSNKKLFDEIVGISLTKEIIDVLEGVSKQKLIYKDWLIAGAGFVNEKRRDGIAIAADYLLSSEKIKCVAVFAIIEQNGGKKYTLDVSLRSRDPNFHMDFFIKEITPNGGGRKYKGAFQVNLDFFTYCPNKTELWEIVSKTVTNAIIQKREELPIIELKGIYKHFKNKIASLFRIVMLCVVFVCVPSVVIQCTKKFGIIRYTTFEDKSYFELSKRKDCALLRYSSFDIAVSALNESDLEKLFSIPQFTKKSEYVVPRIPRLNFYQIVISNVGRYPISLSSVKIQYEKGEINELSKEEIYNRYALPPYSSIDFKNILENKRYMGEKWCFNEMDYEKDVIGYGSNVIMPNDVIVRFSVFDWISVQYRKFSLVIALRNEITLEEKKVVFPLVREEHRRKGKFFTKDNEH